MIRRRSTAATASDQGEDREIVRSLQDIEAATLLANRPDLRRRLPFIDRVRFALGDLTGRWSERKRPHEMLAELDDRFQQPGYLVLDVDDAARDFLFPPEHPQHGHAYALHPRRSRLYLPVGSFHRLVLEDKLREFLSLLAALGARRIEIRAKTNGALAVWSALTASFPIGGQHLATSASSRTGGMSITESLITVELGGHDQPRRPEDGVWLHSEPTWQALVDLRCEGRARAFELDLDYSEEFGIDRRLTSALDDAGVSVGGSTWHFARVEWRVSVTF